MRTRLLLLVLVLTPACLISRRTDSEPLEPARLQQLRPGETTARQAVELLGAPQDVVQLGRRSAYRYQFTSTKRAGLFLLIVGLLNDDTRSDRAWLFFDEDQVLTHVGATFDGDDSRYAMPWQGLH